MYIEPLKAGATLLELAKGLLPAAPKRISTKVAIADYYEAIFSLRTAKHPYNWEQIAEMFASDKIKIVRKASTIHKAYDVLTKERALQEKQEQAKAALAKAAQTKPDALGKVGK